MKVVFNYLLILGIVFLLSCDAKLFETEEEPPAPEVSEIYSSLPNSRIHVGDSTKFWVEASNPGEGNLAYDWDVSSGEFLTAPDEDSLNWRAPFNGGVVTISVNVSNNDKTVGKSKQIEVVSLDIPVVNILHPRDDHYLVQFETIDLKAEAFHDNGISHVEFFVNDSSLGIVDGNSTNEYTMTWLIEESAGQAEIRVTAVARSAATVGSDMTNVYIEGVIPGKNQ